MSSSRPTFGLLRGNSLWVITVLVLYCNLSCEKRPSADEQATVPPLATAEAQPVRFVPTFTPSFVFLLTDKEASHIRDLISKLMRKAPGTKVLSYVPGQEYGSFFYGGREFRWQERYLYYLSSKPKNEWAVVEDDRLLAAFQALDKIGGVRNAFAVKSNDWNFILMQIADRRP